MAIQYDNVQAVSQLERGLGEIGLQVEQSHIEKLISFMRMLLEWNEKVNLTAVIEPREFITLHLIDSLSCLTISKVFSSPAKIIDVGTGAGLPGLPLKFVRGDLQISFLDSLAKRLKFIEAVSESFGLTGNVCIHGRAEDIAQTETHRESYDIAVSRAVARLNVLIELCIPFVRVGGFFIAMKGPAVSLELDDGISAGKHLGAELTDDIELKLPFDGGTRRLLVFKKVSKTPSRYPRKAGTPQKLPL